MTGLRLFCSLKHGEEKAKLYYVAMQKEWAYVEKHCIECNLTAMDTYIHANINVKSQKNQKPIETSHSRGLCRKNPFLLSL